MDFKLNYIIFVYVFTRFRDDSVVGFIIITITTKTYIMFTGYSVWTNMYIFEAFQKRGLNNSL